MILFQRKEWKSKILLNRTKLGQMNLLYNLINYYGYYFKKCIFCICFFLFLLMFCLLLIIVCRYFYLIIYWRKSAKRKSFNISRQFLISVEFLFGFFFSKNFEFLFEKVLLTSVLNGTAVKLGKNQKYVFLCFFSVIHFLSLKSVWFERRTNVWQIFFQFLLHFAAFGALLKKVRGFFYIVCEVSVKILIWC